MHSARHWRYTAGTRRTKSRCETAVSCLAVASRRIASLDRRPRILLCCPLMERRWPTTSAVIWFCSSACQALAPQHLPNILGNAHLLREETDPSFIPASFMVTHFEACMPCFFWAITLWHKVL